jgi:hypothetical protein
MKSCCSNVLIRNTILRFFGLIPVAVIKGRGEIQVLVVEDYLKKWVSKRSLKSFSFYL